ncbi:hypothetical protein D0T51_08195 [Parabacteroides sp. 52]|nr:hypothetical protein [Parabacteroides sp. 52]
MPIAVGKIADIRQHLCRYISAIVSTIISTSVDGYRLLCSRAILWEEKGIKSGAFGKYTYDCMDDSCIFVR